MRHSVDFLTMGVSGGSRPSQSCKCAIVDLRTAFYTLSVRERKFLQKYCLLDNTVCALCRQQADIELASLNWCDYVIFLNYIIIIIILLYATSIWWIKLCVCVMCDVNMTTFDKGELILLGYGGVEFFRWITPPYGVACSGVFRILEGSEGRAPKSRGSTMAPSVFFNFLNEKWRVLMLSGTPF